MKASLATAVIIAMLLVFADAQGAPCLRYGRVVQLVGTLQEHIYPGPPNFASVKAGDRPLKYFRLSLAAPVCATAQPTSVQYVSESNVSFVQLVLDQPGYESYDKLRPALGKVVTLKGKLFSPIDAFHQEPLLMDNIVLVGEQR